MLHAGVTPVNLLYLIISQFIGLAITIFYIVYLRIYAILAFYRTGYMAYMAYMAYGLLSLSANWFLLLWFQMNLSLDQYILGENETILLSCGLCHQFILLKMFHLSCTWPGAQCGLLRGN